MIRARTLLPMVARTFLVAMVAGALLTVISGCEGFLSPEPKSFNTTANFYESPEDFKQAINGVYTEWRGLAADNEYLNATDRRGPTLTKHFDVNLPHTVGGDPQTDEWVMTASNSNSVGLWEDTYDVIKEANVVISRLPDVEFEDGALKQRIMGEAKTIRAFAYWWAVQTWGGVPIVLEDPETPEEAFSAGGRASEEKVYQQVVSDLTDAIPGLPIQYSGGQAGRITKGAAKMLLGRTYLLMGDYQSALSEFEDLDSAKYPYQLLSEYGQVFNPANKNNAESILEIQFNPSLAGQGDFNAFNHFLPINSTEDLLPPETPAFVPDGNFMPTADVLEQFDWESDRFEDSINWYVNEENSSFPEIAWSPRGPNTPPGDSIAYLKKFYWPNNVSSSGEPTNNWIVFRFADVLLSAAEAEWRLNNPEAAVDYVDRLRDRAGSDPVDLNNFDGHWTGSALGDAILRERAVELLGEGHHWYDLKRFGSDIALDRIQAHAERFRQRDPKIDQDEFNIEEFRLLYPIPPGDIDLAGLEQNPGWGQ